ncbi:MAG: ribulose-phosphate 3-epimerase [Thermodesulfobacteriota bacterium]|nr:ribulose-phosphate 3-epimerase [Thermodesulfobacteriota bacterium]|tara:strand:+ start:466 stop:1140 length:675 start_codon:yes stop_codon:yes gene_type:complete
MKNFLAASLIAADFWNLEKELLKLKKTRTKWIHYDIMDGHFVPNITVGSCELDSLTKKTNFPLDVHFMVSNPDYIVPFFVEKYKKKSIANISVHLETCKNIKKMSTLLRKKGIKFGLAINPSTPIDGLIKNIKFVDLLLVMTVWPGFAGQKIIPSTFKKIAKLREFIDKNNLKIPIEVDGGIKINNVSRLIKSGANIIVSGTGIFNTKDYKKTTEAMLRVIENG